MRHVCAWCGAKLSDDTEGNDQEISHGICPSCRKFFLANVRDVTMGDFLDRMNYPVLVVDDDVRAVDGNSIALDFIGKSKEDIVGYHGGDLFECAYARLPGGCGRTEHCRGCAIRKTVGDTYLTGEPKFDVPCYLQRHTPDGEKWIRFLISTVRLKNLVLIKVSEVGEFVPPEEFLKTGMR